MSATGMARLGGGTLGLRNRGELLLRPRSLCSLIRSPTNNRSVESSSMPLPSHRPQGKLKIKNLYIDLYS